MTVVNNDLFLDFKNRDYGIRWKYFIVTIIHEGNLLETFLIYLSLYYANALVKWFNKIIETSCYEIHAKYY